MSYELYPSDPTDREWQYIKRLIPAAKPGGRDRQTDMRLTINAIIYINRTGWGVALPSPRVPALADHLWLLWRLAHHGSLGADSRPLARHGARAELLAERNGSGSGSIYTITITCTNSGGTTTHIVTVPVPHDQGQ
jgi:hypothetical protein